MLASPTLEEDSPLRWNSIWSGLKIVSIRSNSCYLITGHYYICIMTVDDNVDKRFILWWIVGLFIGWYMYIFLAVDIIISNTQRIVILEVTWAGRPFTSHQVTWPLNHLFNRYWPHSIDIEAETLDIDSIYLLKGGLRISNTPPFITARHIPSTNCHL